MDESIIALERELAQAPEDANLLAKYLRALQRAGRSIDLAIVRSHSPVIEQILMGLARRLTVFGYPLHYILYCVCFAALDNQDFGESFPRANALFWDPATRDLVLVVDLIAPDEAQIKVVYKILSNEEQEEVLMFPPQRDEDVDEYIAENFEGVVGLPISAVQILSHENVIIPGHLYHTTHFQFRYLPSSILGPAWKMLNQSNSNITHCNLLMRLDDTEVPSDFLHQCDARQRYQNTRFVGGRYDTVTVAGAGRQDRQYFIPLDIPVQQIPISEDYPKDAVDTLYPAALERLSQEPREVPIGFHHTLLYTNEHNELIPLGIFGEKDKDDAKSIALILAASQIGIPTIRAWVQIDRENLFLLPPRSGETAMRRNPSHLPFLQGMTENVEGSLDNFEENYPDSYNNSIDIQEEKEAGNVYYGRNVIWIGRDEQTVRVDPDYVKHIDGNNFDLRKLASIRDAIKELPHRVVFYAGYGQALKIQPHHIRDSIETQKDLERTGHPGFDPLDRPYTTGDDELDEYLVEPANFKGRKKEMERRLKKAVKEGSGDLGKWFYIIRDGNHRAFGALLAGEPYIYMRLYDLDYQEYLQGKRPELGEILE